MGCSCNSGVKGFGTPTCVDLAGRAIGFLFQKTKKNGAYNQISGLSTFSQSAYTTLLYSNDGDLRISALRNAKNVEDARGESKVQTIDDIDYFLAKGQRKITLDLIGAPAKLAEYIDSLRCGEYSVYMVTPDNQLVGWNQNTIALRGIPIEKGTVDTMVMQATREGFSQIRVSFMIADSFKDSEIGSIPASQIEADLIGTNSQIWTYTSNNNGVMLDATHVQVSVFYAVNGSTTPMPYEGATATDFSLFNFTTSAPISIVGVVETADGVYSIEIAAQTAGDQIETSPTNGSKFAFDDFLTTAV